MIRIVGSYYCCYTFFLLFVRTLYSDSTLIQSSNLSLSPTSSLTHSLTPLHTFRVFFFSVSQLLVCSLLTMVRCQQNSTHTAVWWLDRKIFTHYVYNDVRKSKIPNIEYFCCCCWWWMSRATISQAPSHPNGSLSLCRLFHCCRFR